MTPDWDDLPDMGTYILDDEHRPVKATMLQWSRWYMDFDNRRVAQDETRFYAVSTVFLGVDHNWRGKGLPVLFESMVFERKAEIREFAGKLFPARESVDMWRYASWDDALTGHKAILRRLRKQEADAVKAINKEEDHEETDAGATRPAGDRGPPRPPSR